VYFVTLCAANRQCLFGTVVDAQMRLNDCGIIVGSLSTIMRQFKSMVTTRAQRLTQ
jgi:hypothetical protein